MRVLVATASKHGATREIGTRLGAEISAGLTGRGLVAEVDTLDVADVDAIAEYDAVVLGSAVYMGRWLRSARKLVDREQAELETRPVWLFSSGPVGAADSASQNSSNTKWVKATWAVEHRVFAGKIDKSALSAGERFIARLVKADDVDTRDKADVDQWAVEICDRLSAVASTRT